VTQFNLLITGARSGLGFAVHERLGGTALLRDMSIDDARICTSRPFDAIVHCAVNTSTPVTMKSCYTYLKDNFLLTQKLLDVPHRKFIYLSTLDVYPRLGRAISEVEDIDLSALVGPYPFVKLFSDVLVQAHAANHLVLRTSTLLGKEMRRTVARRLLTERNWVISLSAESRYNYLLQEDVIAFIQFALETDLTGVYNLASLGTVRLGDIVADLGLTGQLGDKLYDVGPIDATSAAKLMPAFGRESRETLNLFIDSLGEQFVGRGRLLPK
jgi:nucleoside-diphosphate-sugar epimerase